MMHVLLTWVWFEEGEEDIERGLSSLEYDTFREKFEEARRQRGSIIATVVFLLIVVSIGLCVLLQDHWTINLLLGTGLQWVLGLT